MMKIQNLKSFICGFLLILLISFENILFMVDFTPLNEVQLRVCYLFVLYILISIIIIREYNNYKSLKLPVTLLDFLLVVFFLLLSIRLYYDINICQVYHLIFGHRWMYLFWLVFLCIIPFYIIRKINFLQLNFVLIYKVLIFIYLIGLIFSFNNVVNAVAQEMLNTTNIGRNEASTILDTITYGHFAVSLFLLCFSLYSYVKSFLFKFSLVLICLFSLFSMGIANSRSPIVALIIAMLFFCFARKYFKWIIPLSICAFLIIYNIDIIEEILKTFGSDFIGRIRMTFESGIQNSSSGRDQLYLYAVNQFLKDPLLGSNYLVDIGKYRGLYVHNFILEAFMATGILGGLLFVVVNIWAFRCAYKILAYNNIYVFFAFFFIQQFVYAMFSRTMLSMPCYWFSMACVCTCCFQLEKYNNKI